MTLESALQIGAIRECDVRYDDVHAQGREPRQIVTPADPRRHSVRIGRADDAAFELVGQGRMGCGPAQNMPDAGDDEGAPLPCDHFSLDDVGEVSVALKDPEIQRGSIEVPTPYRRIAQEHAEPAARTEPLVLLADRAKERRVFRRKPDAALRRFAPRSRELFEIDGVAAYVRIEDRLEASVAELDDHVVHDVAKRRIGYEIP